MTNLVYVYNLFLALYSSSGETYAVTICTLLNFLIVIRADYRMLKLKLLVGKSPGENH